MSLVDVMFFPLLLFPYVTQFLSPDCDSLGQRLRRHDVSLAPLGAERDNTFPIYFLLITRLVYREESPIFACSPPPRTRHSPDICTCMFMDSSLYPLPESCVYNCTL